MPSMGNRFDYYNAALGEHIATTNSADTPAPEKEKPKEPSNPAFTSLAEKQKERYEKLQVHAGDRSIAKMATLLAKNVGDVTQDVAATAISAGTIGYASSVLVNGEKSDTKGHIAQAATASLTMATATLVRASVSAVVTGSKLDELSAQHETFKNVKRETTPEYLAPYPEDIKEDVKALDLRVEREIKAGNSNALWFKKQIDHRENVLLARPLNAIDLTCGRDAGSLRSMMNQVADLCKHTEDPEAFKTLAMRIIMNSVSEKPTRVQAVFHGPGGVGKTWLIEQLVKIIKGRLIYLRMEDSRHESSVKKMLGSRWSAEYYPPDAQDKDVIGELPLEMIKAGCTNPIIFIDELKINGETIGDLNVLLDPLKKELKIGGYNSSLDWSRATILIGTNDAIKNEPLQTRLLMMHFSKASDEVKRLVVMDRVKVDAEVFRHLLSGNDMKRLVSTMETRCDELIAIDNEKFPGARYIQSAASHTVNFVAEGLLTNEPRKAHEISDFMRRRYEHFAEFEPNRTNYDSGRD